MYRLIHV